MMEFKNLTESMMETFLEYIERNIREVVHVKTTKIDLAQLVSMKILDKSPILTSVSSVK